LKADSHEFIGFLPATLVKTFSCEVSIICNVIITPYANYVSYAVKLGETNSGVLFH